MAIVLKMKKASIGRDVEKQEPLCIAAGTVRWCSLRKTVW
jgi:hypothetical protein